MTDANLRALERAALADPAQRAAWLSARMRAGELPRERVELAAYCGDEAALPLLSAKEAARLRYPGPHMSGEVPFERWVRGLSRWGHEVMVRAGLAAAERAWCRWAVEEAQRAEAARRHGKTEVFRRYRQTRSAMDAVRAWLDDPSEANRQRVFFRSGSPGCVINVVMAVIGDQAPNSRTSRILKAVGGAAEATSESQVRQAMQRELIAWALGTPGRPA